MIAARLAICDGCPHKVQISPLGQRIIQAINQSASTFVCGVCGCPLAGLTASPNASCKKGRWGVWHQDESYYG